MGQHEHSEHEAILETGRSVFVLDSMLPYSARSCEKGEA
jgi:hypothetical protein